MGKSLCLNMIVRNESRVIERMLRSVCPLIRHYCICDTGSTDDTCQRIEAFFRCHHPSITGTITHEPFRDFSYNRNVALQDCILRYAAHCDAVLLMDADMVLLSDGNRALPDADYYYIMQGSTSRMQYKNVRIIRMDPSYHYVGATHEYLHVPAGHTGHLIDASQLTIDDVGDGGSKAEKFTRDIGLLLRTLEAEPTNSRALFYLANSYMDTGRYTDAIAYYQKRIECGGWSEEQYVSSHRAGLCYLHLGKEADAIAAWVSACHYSKSRLESLHELIRLHRLNGRYSTAMGFYVWAQATRATANARDYLFMQCDVYDFRIDYEYTIIAFYNDQRDVLDAAVRVLNRCTDRALCANVLDNLGFYQHTAACSRVADLIDVDAATSEPIASCLAVVSGALVLYVAHKDPSDGLLVVHRLDARTSAVRAVRSRRVAVAAHMLPHVRLTSSADGSVRWTCGSQQEGAVYMHSGVVDADDAPDGGEAAEAVEGADPSGTTATDVETTQYVLSSTSAVAWVGHTATSECVIVDLGVARARDERPHARLRVLRPDLPRFFSHVSAPFYGCRFDDHLWCVGHVHVSGRDVAYIVAFVCDESRVLRFSGPLTLHDAGSCVGLYVDAHQVCVVWRSSGDDGTSSKLRLAEYGRDSFDRLMCYDAGT